MYYIYISNTSIALPTKLPSSPILVWKVTFDASEVFAFLLENLQDSRYKATDDAGFAGATGAHIPDEDYPRYHDADFGQYVYDGEAEPESLLERQVQKSDQLKHLRKRE